MTNLLLFLGLMVSSVNASTTTSNSVYATTSQEVIEVSSSTIQQLINSDSNHWGVSSSTMRAVIRCESGFRTDAFNPKDPSYGIAQFTPDTFYQFAPLAGITKPNIGSPIQQLWTMAYMMAHNKSHRWSCYRMLYPNWNKV
jgi:hypothetical protein